MRLREAKRGKRRRGEAARVVQVALTLSETVKKSPLLHWRLRVADPRQSPLPPPPTSPPSRASRARVDSVAIGCAPIGDSIGQDVQYGIEENGIFQSGTLLMDEYYLQLTVY